MRPLGATDPNEVGRYRVIAELGQGGMGRVLLGYGSDGRLVAVKQVRPQLTEDDGFRARFRREVAATRKVSGAYTAAVVDADADAPVPWLASVFTLGPSLREVVDGTGPLPEEAVLRLAAGLAAALGEIHRVGLVHRDLKPSNVLLTNDGPRVIDFGIARAVESDGNSELTRTGWLVGSPEFMSPEQAEGRALTPASDVFSLGGVLVMSCTGQVPFAGPSMPRILYRIVHGEPDLTAIPEGLRPIVQSCLAKDPTARPAPAQLLEMIGEIAPSAQPWPPQVHRLIAQQHADVARLLSPSDEQAGHPGNGVATLARTRLQLGPPVLDDERSRTGARDTNEASEDATAAASVPPVASPRSKTDLVGPKEPGGGSTAAASTRAFGPRRFSRRGLVVVMAAFGVVVLLAVGLPLVLSGSQLPQCDTVQGGGTPDASGSITPPPRGTPHSPSLVAPNDQAVFTLGQQITLTWSYSSEVSKVGVKFENSGWKSSDWRPVNNCAFTPAQPGLYQWMVTTANSATGAAGSPWSEQRYFLVQPTTQPTIEPAPGRPHPPSLNGPGDQAVFPVRQEITLIWTTPAVFSKLLITAPDGTQQESNWQEAKSYTIFPSTSGTYLWSVLAANHGSTPSGASEQRYLLIR